ncbi:MAG: QueT transporter family protein [Eubacteriaceae bacterium]
MNKKVKYIVKAGIIAALYAVITVSVAPISYGGMQIRISEAMAVIPYFTTSAVPGLFIGCLIANFFGSPLGMLDVVLGSLTSLIAAFMTSKIKTKVLVPLPSIILNALIIPFVLWKVLGLPYFISVIWVGLGQTISVYGLGYPLLKIIEKNKSINEIIKD